MKLPFALRTIALLRKWQLGKISRDTFIMTIGLGLRTFGQAAVFLIIARVLRISDYGAYSAVLALAGAFASFSGFGTQTLLVRDISRNPEYFSIAWGRILGTILFTTPFFLVAYLATAWLILPSNIPFIIAISIGLAELFFNPIGLAAQSAFQGHEHIRGMAQLMLIPVLSRLFGALILFPLSAMVSPTSLLKSWAILYALAGLASAIYSLNIVNRGLGRPSLPTMDIFYKGLREGMPFAFSSAAMKLYTDIDKAMLAKFSTLDAVGAYSAAYRVVDFATVPIMSLLTVTTPQFFRAGEANVQNSFQYARKILPIPLVYALIVGIVFYLAAGLLPLVLGNSFAAAVPSLQWLAWLPLISLPRQFFQTSLISSNYQNFTMIILGSGAALNIALNIWLIPMWSWQGAVVATYFAEIFMASTMLLVARKLY
ncbi:uncharacterized protein NMK_3285 [Novimethylophilus kurashikiensis]|uniref:Uncharacterized protein n=1 Tax=Novimethylophilus kurashikiensis TaxID=1825523 RepID=A0A2R5FIC1_9PROT|nr:flippase [Novimethylophilus kurashikiensis]GBG15674.1 uncharacterized protein NMK_3285 [Novimethylophilus kurashikiensis]